VAAPELAAKQGTTEDKDLYRYLVFEVPTAKTLAE
jgi:hypothetical protein